MDLLLSYQYTPLMKIYIIRHGESTSDVKQKYDGDYDDHLTEKGIGEARMIAQDLKGKGIEIVFSSPKIRAQETSKVICDKLGCSYDIINNLAEQDIYGAFPELGKDQPEEEYRRLGEILANRGNVFEGAEAYADFKKRVIEAFSEVTEKGCRAVAIVTHGGPIRCFFREILKFGEFKNIGNGAIIEMEGKRLDLRVVGFTRAKLV